MEKFDKDAARKEIQKLIHDVLNRKKVKVDLEDIKEGVSLTTQLGIDSLDILQVAATVEEIQDQDPRGGAQARRRGAILRAVENTGRSITP